MSKANGNPCKKCGANDWRGSVHCKPCDRAYRKAYYQANKAKIAAYRKAYYQANKAKIAASNKAYRQANKAKIAASHKAYHQANKPKRAAYAKDYHQANKANAAAYAKAYRQANPDKKRATAAKRKTYKTKAGGSFTSVEWGQLCKQYGNKCLACGRDDLPLTADHIIPVSQGGNSNIVNIQPLCKSCNSAKGNYHTTDYRKFHKAGKIIRQLRLF